MIGRRRPLIFFYQITTDARLLEETRNIFRLTGDSPFRYPRASAWITSEKGCCLGASFRGTEIFVRRERARIKIRDIEGVERPAGVAATSERVR